MKDEILNREPGCVHKTARELEVYTFQQHAHTHVHLAMT